MTKRGIGKLVNVLIIAIVLMAPVLYGFFGRSLSGKHLFIAFCLFFAIWGAIYIPMVRAGYFSDEE
jgi:hypothetical protein